MHQTYPTPASREDGGTGSEAPYMIFLPPEGSDAERSLVDRMLAAAIGAIADAPGDAPAQATLMTAALRSLKASRRKEAVKEAGRHFDTAVSIIPQADLAAKDAEIARLRGALAETAAILQAEAARATGQPFTGEWNIPSLGVKATVGQALDRANAALATEGGADA